MSARVDAGSGVWPIRSREQFVREMTAWLNRRLAPPGVTIEPDTPLFENGLIDSIRILRVIAWTERAIGRAIPDEQIRLDRFRDAERIAANFVETS